MRRGGIVKRMRRWRWAVVLAALLATAARADLPLRLVQEYGPAVVHILVDGKVDGQDCPKRGTGFLVDGRGFILTAAHNVLPCRRGGAGLAQWDTPPTVGIRYVEGPPDAPVTKNDIAVVVYADPQTDLALLRSPARPGVPLPLAPPGTLEPGAGHTVMIFEVGQAAPSPRSVVVESLFNPGQHHDGLIDISGPDMEPSSSGGPLFDDRGFVAAVFTKGRRQVGEAAVPVSYAAPLFQMVGISYPSQEVRDVIEELLHDLLGWHLRYETSTGNVTASFRKRLVRGESPVLYEARFAVYTKDTGFGISGEPKFAFHHEIEVPQGPILGGKKGTVVFRGVGPVLDLWIQAHNDHVAADPTAGSRWGQKAHALVTVRVQFRDEVWKLAAGDLLLEFE